MQDPIWVDVNLCARTRKGRHASPRSAKERGSIAAAFELFTLALFLNAGNLKADPRLAFLPLDLTVLIGGILVPMVLIRFALEPQALVPKLSFVLAFFLLLSSPLLTSTVSTTYSVEKTARMFTLTFLACAAPLALIRNVKELEIFFQCLALIGLVMALDAAVSYATGPRATRLVVSQATTIASGRVIGLTAIWIAINSVDKRGIVFGLSVLAFFGMVILGVGTGSRGPLLGMAISLFLSGAVLMVKRGNGFWRLRTLVYVLTISMAIPVGLSIAPEASSQRLSNSVSDSSQLEGESRADLVALSLKEIPNNPLGLGWGGFEGFSGGLFRYPHNFVLEMFLEGGWLIGVAALSTILFGLYRCAHLAWLESGLTPVLLLGVFLFSLVNAQLSGDINDNRLFLSLLVLTVSFGGPSTRDVGHRFIHYLRWSTAQQEQELLSRNK